MDITTFRMRAERDGGLDRRDTTVLLSHIDALTRERDAAVLAEREACAMIVRLRDMQAEINRRLSEHVDEAAPAEVIAEGRLMVETRATAEGERSLCLAALPTYIGEGGARDAWQAGYNSAIKQCRAAIVARSKPAPVQP